MPQICVRFNDSDYAAIEQRAEDGNTTKPRVVLSMVGFALRAYSMGLTQPTEEIEHLNSRIAMLEQQLRDKEDSLGYLRQEYSKLNEAVTQRLLPEVRVGFWRRLVGSRKKE